MNKKFQDIDSIIFDLDGTLWDSREEVAMSWTDILKDSDCDRKSITAEEISRLMGKTLIEIADILFPSLEKEQQIDLITKCAIYENEYLRKNGAKLFDKLEYTLKELSKKYKLFIVSNCQDGYIEAFFDYFGLKKYFLDYECPGMSDRTKADNIKLVVDRNNLKKPIYVGDTQGDKDATKKAGLEFVFAEYGFGQVDSFDYKIDKIVDLLDLI